jgi:hypothetical protein
MSRIETGSGGYNPFGLLVPCSLCERRQHAMQDARIRRVSISHFRGVPQDLTIDFGVSKSSQPLSLILYGENGKGKSSIVDALEFALQGRVRRSKEIVNRSAPFTVSLADRGRPDVQVELADGTVVTRSAELRDDGIWRITDGIPHPAFSYGPFVLRRSDILQFLTTPESRRQLVFSDFRLGRTDSSRETAEELGELPSQAILSVEEQRLSMKNKRRWVAAQLAHRLGCDPLEVPIDLNDFDRFIVDRLYGGLTSAEARRRNIRRGELDPEIKQLLWQFRDSTREISELRVQIKKLKSVDNSSSRFHDKLRGIAGLLEEVGDHIGEHFGEISNVPFIERVILTCGDGAIAALKVELELSNGTVCTPHQVLSEANLDLLALLVFLAFAQEAATHGQAKVLVLDDVFQSVDAAIRLSVVELILREFTGWQLFFTAHDRLWYEQLLHLFRQKGQTALAREIVAWTFDAGPTVREARVDADARLLDALNSTDAALICSAAGLLLEEICDRLSWTLPISVQRKRGDKYTLGDLWPGTLKTLRKTSLCKLVENVDRLMHLRNMVGAHYNEWAQSVSLDEARTFGEAVVELFWSVRCDSCFRWMEATSDRSWQCRCGRVGLEILRP